MKIGILTFHSAYNFGAVLQCYALYSTIKGLGYDVCVIDYRPSYLASRNETFHWYTFINKSPWKLFQRVGAVIDSKRHFRLFDTFINRNVKLSTICTSKEELIKVCNLFDCVVVGSDQVWCDKFNGSDTSWFGVDTKSKIKWIGYAVSAGKTKYDLRQIRSLTSKFSSIGAREFDLYELLKETPKKNISHVLDPTLLAPTKVWKEWYNPIVNEPYILIYQARECSDIFRIAKDVANQLGVTRILPVDFYKNVRENGLKTYVCSPDQFVSLVKNAQCVVTTSFHGTAFSVIFGTPFYTIKLNDGADGRSESLLNSVGLSDRFIDSSAIVSFSKYNSKKTSFYLDRLREESLNFIIESLR